MNKDELKFVPKFWCLLCILGVTLCYSYTTKNTKRTQSFTKMMDNNNVDERQYASA